MTVNMEIDDGFLVIDGHYEIALDRIPNQAAILEWLMHMTEKTWFTSPNVAKFILVVCEAKGWEIYGHEGDPPQPADDRKQPAHG